MYPRNPNTSNAPAVTAIAICVRVNPILREILSGWQITARLPSEAARVHVRVGKLGSHEICHSEPLADAQRAERACEESAAWQRTLHAKRKGTARAVPPVQNRCYSFLSSDSSFTGSTPPSC